MKWLLASEVGLKNHSALLSGLKWHLEETEICVQATRKYRLGTLAIVPGHGLHFLQVAYTPKQQYEGPHNATFLHLE